MIRLYNTLSRKKEIFKPLKDKQVGLYTCGPTVYLYAHIGNLRTYIFEDLLKRVLGYNDYKVRHVMNITDVGHLTSDADTGEDKMEKGAQREKKTVWDIADFYTQAFKQDLSRLNIKEPDVWIKATETIKEQIELIKLLETKGYTYRTEDGIYFDTSKIKDYGKLCGEKKRDIKPGARVAMIKGKKNPCDFALWKFSPQDSKRQMEWDSPWGRGFPGWHTECVIMSAKELGIPFDIHCGGIDHIAVHHTNEIVQAEAAYEKPLARFWLHGEFLILKKGRMGKSEGNIITLNDLIEKEINPLAYRYLCLTAHYRSPLTFSLKNLRAAENALKKLYKITAELKACPDKKAIISRKAKGYQKQFLKDINNDLAMPQAIALVWTMLDDEKLNKAEKYALLVDWDKVLGLGLETIKEMEIPKTVVDLVEKREKMRTDKDWSGADKVRKKIEKAGYTVRDTKKGPEIKCNF